MDCKLQDFWGALSVQGGGPPGKGEGKGASRRRGHAAGTLTMSGKGYCGPDCVPVQSCRDGPLAICRILQAVLAGLLLFTGIVCQFWAGSNVNDIPLSNLCNAYSGSSEVMQAGDFSDLLDWWEDSVLKCTSRRKCANFQGVLPPHTHVPLSLSSCSSF